MKTKPLACAAAAAFALLGGCSGPNERSYPYSSSPPAARVAQYGVVERIEVVDKGAGSNVAGTVIGGIIGGMIGHQIGSGRGQDAATIAGAAGGAYAGHQMQQRRSANHTFRVTVRMEDGSYHTITQDDITDLRTGDRVRIDGNRLYRH